MAPSTLSLSDLVPTSTSSIPNPKPIPAPPSSVTTNPTLRSTSKPNTEPQTRKLKSSPQLTRWSRARAIRSGRKLDRPVHQTTQTIEMKPPVSMDEGEATLTLPVIGNGREDDVEVARGKSVYMVSDGTGWTVEHSVNAALGQFEHCLVDRVCPVNTHLFSGD